MLFVASLLFTFLCFVIPGELALLLGAKVLATVFPVPALTLEIGLNGILFLALWKAAHYMPFLYTELQMDTDARCRMLKGFLQVRGLRWLNVAVMIILTGAAAAMLVRGILPFPFVYLYGAILLGFADLVFSGRSASILKAAQEAASQDDTPTEKNQNAST